MIFVCYSSWPVQVLVGHNFPPQVPHKAGNEGQKRGTLEVPMLAAGGQSNLLITGFGDFYWY